MLVEVQEWRMPDPREEYVCTCGHYIHDHRVGDGFMGECIDCEQDPDPRLQRCERFRPRQPSNIAKDLTESIGASRLNLKLGVDAQSMQAQLMRLGALLKDDD